MFDTIQSILAFLITLITALTSLTGFVVAMLKNGKNAQAKKIAEKTNEILELVKCKVMEVENTFAKASTALKEQGISTGEIKKESVMSFIESKCYDKDIAFDEKYWSEQVESIIKILNYNK